MKRLVGVVIALFFIAAFLRIDFYFKIIYLLAAVYLLARFWTHRSLEHLRAERRFVNRAFSGEEVPVELKVENDDWLPVPWLEIHESLSVELAAPPFYREVVTLGPYENRRFHYSLYCKKRGYYNVGPSLIHTGDLLGVEEARSGRLEEEHIIVYPRVFPLEKLGLPTRSPLAALPAPAPLFEDPTRIMGVRAYQPGDSPRRIHWTASASAGQLLVKRYQPAIARETLICLNLHEDDYQLRHRLAASELAIVTTASIANHIVVRDGLQVGIATHAWDPLLEKAVHFSLPPRRERAHLMSILEILARAQMVQEQSFPDLLRRESMSLAWGATMAVITGSQSEKLIDTLVYLRRAGFAVQLILVMPAAPPAELYKRAESLGVPVHRVWREDDLEAGI